MIRFIVGIFCFRVFLLCGTSQEKFKVSIRIEGKIQKPEAFYVLQKSSINYDWLDLKQDFIPKILDSVSRAPF